MVQYIAERLAACKRKTYEAGAKLDWHSHPGGQVLLITEGAGDYQERRKPARVVRKDVIKCAPGVEHWHGATPNNRFLIVSPSSAGNSPLTAAMNWREAQQK